jgi:hypothetical protein
MSLIWLQLGFNAQSVITSMNSFLRTVHRIFIICANSGGFSAPLRQDGIPPILRVTHTYAIHQGGDCFPFVARCPHETIKSIILVRSP